MRPLSKEEVEKLQQLKEDLHEWEIVRDVVDDYLDPNPIFPRWMSLPRWKMIRFRQIVGDDRLEEISKDFYEDVMYSIDSAKESL